jgi:hypothetical protein
LQFLTAKGVRDHPDRPIRSGWSRSDRLINNCELTPI